MGRKHGTYNLNLRSAGAAPLLRLGATRGDPRVPRDEAERLAHRLGEPEEHQRVEGGAEAQEAEERVKLQVEAEAKLRERKRQINTE